MGLNFYKAMVADIHGCPLIPSDLVSEKEMNEFEEYMKMHPFPEDTYTKEEFLDDMGTSGPYSMPIDVKETTVDYVRGMLNAVLFHKE